MDLRLRLVSRLSLAFATLMAVFMLVWLADARQDTQAEQTAALQLVDLLTPALQRQRPDSAALEDRLRHLRVRLEARGTPQTPQTAAAPWLALADAQAQERRIPLGDQVLVISPNPDSELQEQLHASLQVIAMLVAFGALCLFLTWRAADQALRPARELEAGLQRLQDGEASPGLPAFELREFSRLAQRIEQLAQALTQSQARQASLTGALMDVQDQERRMLATELHDEFGQSLTAISATATYIEHHASRADSATLAECAREIGQETRRISDHVHQMLSQLKPYGLGDTGTPEALQELVSHWQARLSGMQLTLQMDALPRLSEDLALALYRSLQEALTNAVRHSQANRIQIACTVHDDALSLVVTDNGTGHASVLAQASGHGLPGLRERLRRVGGQLQIHDNPTGGIVLSARIPLPKKMP